MGCKPIWLPLLLEMVGETTARMQEVEQRMEQLPRRIKTTIYIPLIPTFSLKGEGAGTCVDTYGQGCLHGAYNFVASICQGIKNQVLVHVISLGCELATAIGSLGQFLPFSFSAELQIIRTSDTT